MADLSNQRVVAAEEGSALAESWGVPFIECSAKENFNVTEVFNTLIKEIEKDTGLLVQPPASSRCTIL
jgi:hypothetical protein